MKWIKDNFVILLAFAITIGVIAFGVWCKVSIIRSDLPIWMKWLLLK